MAVGIEEEKAISQAELAAVNEYSFLRTKC